MPSIFEIYGELGLKSDKLEAGLTRVDGRLKSAQVELGKTEAKSKLLGDTSATVSRRYEKLSEAIGANNSRLSEAVSAYTRGEISARKYASVLANVERATASVSSRIKDANARVAEIGSTGLTHFQQQIRGATSQLSNLSGILTGNRLSGITSEFTSLGLAVSSLPGPMGLAAGAFSTLAASAAGAGGILFGLAKQASDFGSIIHDTAEKTGLSTKVISSIKVAADESGSWLENVSKGLRRFTLLMADAQSGSEKSQKALAGLHVTSTDLTEGLGQVVKQIYLLPAGLQQNEAAAAAFGKKLGADLIPFINQFQGDLPALIAETERLGLTIDGTAADAADKFGDQLDTLTKQTKALGYNIGFALLPQVNDLASSFSKFLTDNKTETAAWAKSIANEFQTVTLAIQQEKNDIQALGEILNTLNPFSNETWDSLPERLKKYTLEDTRISIARSRIGKTNDSPFNLDDDYANRFSLPYAPVSKALADDDAASEGPATKLKEKIKSIADESSKTAKQILETKRTIGDLFVSSTDNPFVKIFNDTAQAIDRATEATAGLSKGIRDAIVEAVKGKGALADFAQQVSNRTGSYDLQSKGKEFAQGFLNENNPGIKSLQNAIANEDNPQRRQMYQGLLEGAQNLQTQTNFQGAIDAIGQAPFIAQQFAVPKGLSVDEALKRYPGASILSDIQGKFATGGYNVVRDPGKQSIIDKAIIDATKGLDPAKLTPQQDAVAAGAYKREATRVANQKDDAAELIKALLSIINPKDGLKVMIGGSEHTIKFLNKPDNVDIKETRKGTPQDADWRYPR
jgi:hypothetical protein